MQSAHGLRIKEVKEVGFCAEFFFQHKDSLVLENIIDVGIRIVQVAKDAGTGRTGFLTRRGSSFACSVQTEVAFLHGPLRTNAV
jgi:hypothetical protein